MSDRVTLRNFELFKKIAVLDTGRRKLIEEYEPEDPHAIVECGDYLVIGQELVAIFRSGETVNLIIGDCLYDDLNRVTCTYRDRGRAWARFLGLEDWITATKESRLSILVDDVLKHELIYKPIDYGVPPALDFTMCSLEDFDFLLYLKNLLSDPPRRDRWMRSALSRSGSEPSK